MTAEQSLNAKKQASTGLLLTGFLALAMAASTSLIFFPGFMSFDSLQQYRQAVGQLPLADAHPTAMTLLWRSLMWIYPNPGTLLIFHQLIYWSAVAIFAIAVARRLWARLLIVVILGLWPPIFINSLHLWKDVGMLACYMLAVAALVADKRFPHIGWIVTAALALVYGTAVRHNAILALIPLTVLLASRVTWRSDQFRKRQWRAHVSIIAVMVATWFGANAITNMHANHVGGLGTILVWDMVAVSIAEGRDLIPAYMPKAEGEIMPQLEQTFSPNANYHSYSVVSPYPPNGTIPLLTDWLRLVVDHPIPYFLHRSQLFATILGLREQVYYPFHPGIDENEFGAKLLNFQDVSRRDLILTLESIATWPIYRFFPYFIILAALSVWLVVKYFRRKVLISSERDALLVAISGLAICIPLFVLAPAADYRFILWPITSSMLALIIVFSPALRAVEEPR